MRVCNYCYKQWEHGITTFDNEIRVDHNTSLSTTNLAMASSKTNSSSITLCSIPYSIGLCHQMQQDSSLSPRKSHIIRGEGARSGVLSSPEGVKDLVAGLGDPLPHQYG